MKRITVATIVLACSLATGACASEYYTHHGRERSPAPDSLALMTKQDVIALSKAGVGDDVIIGMMNISGSYFPLRTRDVIELADSGVSDKVIGAMIKTAEMSQSGEAARGYYYYPPLYWFAGYPFLYPWYSPVYLGFWSGYYGPQYVHRWYQPRYGFPGNHRFYGGAVSGGARFDVRHR